eukprot:TRINITY_DN2254_c0_g5_i3.p1 TRINITY_DN2254_c0_g5~~TRINITY_DN2254_c0_g5_i3.p1  ORF type:complete len:433 (-),score=94.44 TRINITY_DN2254_c0_g5_i3:559-1857(-)
MDPLVWASLRDEGSGRTTNSYSTETTHATTSAPVDVREYQDRYIFTADIPGVKSNQIRVQIEAQNILSITGERIREDNDFNSAENDEQYLRLERFFGPFSRKFTMPGDCNYDAISLSFSEGILTVNVPKLLAPELNASQIQDFQECMEGNEEYHQHKQYSESILKQQNGNGNEGDKTGTVEEMFPGDADAEMFSSSDFIMGTKDGKNRLWPKSTISILISKFEEIYNKLNCGKLGKKHWDLLADEMNRACNCSFTGMQCRYKWNRLKKSYKKEKMKREVSGAKSSNWPYYDEIDRVIGKSLKVGGLPEGFEGLPGGFDGVGWKNMGQSTLSKKKESETDLIDDDILKVKKQGPASSSRQREPRHAKDIDMEGKRVKRMQSTMDAIAVAMQTNMKRLTETMKEIEQNKMRQESMQLDKILETQLEIARLFARN